MFFKRDLSREQALKHRHETSGLPLPAKAGAIDQVRNSRGATHPMGRP